MTEKCHVLTCSETKNLEGTYCRVHRGLTKEKPETLKDVIEILDSFELCHFSSGCEHDGQYYEIMEVLRSMKA